MKLSMKYLSFSLLALALGACSGLATKSPGADPGQFQGSPIDQGDSPERVRVVYFDFDKSDIRPEFVSLISAHGELLASDSGRRVVLEGHADERGSREYNVALGERRALAVRRILLSGGARLGQVRVVSYGEERPAVDGHNESAWSKNRRVEIRYE